MQRFHRRTFLQWGGSAAALLTGLTSPIASTSAAKDAQPPLDMPGFIEPTFPNRSFSIVDCGAVSDATTKNTSAIARTIAACAEAGGGHVVVPAGIWLTGPIHLKSNVDLHLADGAELRFSQEFDDYLPVVYMQRGGVRCFNYSPLIYAHQCTNIAVTGRGTLNGQGQVWWPWKNKQPGMKRLFRAGAEQIPLDKRVFGTVADGVRPPFIQPIECRNVLLEGFTIHNGPSWNVHPVLSENVTVRGIRVITHGPNNDGIDPDCCRNVLIEDCLLDVGDDCICLKAGRDEDAWSLGRPCENVIVRRCRTKRGHGGIVLGSEMSAGIRNVFVDDCHFDGTQRGIRIKSCPGRGGVIENVWIQNITMDRILGEAIHITLNYPTDSRTRTMPTFRNLQVRGVTCTSAKRAVAIQGLPEAPIQKVNLEDLRINAQSGFLAEHVHGLRLVRVNVTPKRGPVMQMIESQDVSLAETNHDH